MWNTLVNSSRIRRAYSINSIIYSLKATPIISKFVSSSEYYDGPIRQIATFLSWVKTVVTFCLGEIVYVLALVGASAGASAITAFNDAEGFINMPAATIFINLFFYLALIGIPVNNILFDVSEDKYYSIVLMRMNAKKYVLSDMFYRVFRKFIGYSLMFTLLVINTDIKPMILLAFMVLTLMGKFIGAYVKMKFIEKDKLDVHAGITVIVALVIFLLGGFLTFKNISFSHTVIYGVTGTVFVLGVFALYKLITYPDYNGLCKNFLKPDLIFNVKENASKTTKESAQKNITVEADENDLTTSNKEGYAYFNELFVRRHSKLLKRRSKLISIVISMFTIGAAVGLLIAKNFFNMGPISSVSKFLFSMPLIIYFINSGESLASAMFVNCDSAMLTYNFYRKPGVILGVFRARLKTVISINIIPAILLACALSVFNFFSLQSGNILNYVAYFIFCPALSVFFSVHRLMIYYLLQPYTEGLESKSPAYNLANSATYFITYMIFMANDSITLTPIIFALIGTGISAVYVLVALLLVYKLAPKRFRIHK